MARLAPDAPTPRSETPCVVGFAVRLPARRKSVKPGTCRRRSSSVSAAVVSSSTDVSKTTLAGVSSSRASVRTTVTCSEIRRGESVIVIERNGGWISTVVFSKSFELTSSKALAETSMLKTNEPRSSVRVSTVRSDARSRAFSPDSQNLVMVQFESTRAIADVCFFCVLSVFSVYSVVI
jgi:hypothetical protein